MYNLCKYEKVMQLFRYNSLIYKKFRKRIKKFYAYIPISCLQNYSTIFPNFI